MLAVVTNTAVPFQPLPARMAGLLPDETLHDGVPRWLTRPLQDWLIMALHKDTRLARRIVIRLRYERTVPVPDIALLSGTMDEQLLTAVDALLQLHPGWGWRPDEIGWSNEPVHGDREWWDDAVTELEQLLVDGASLYTVDADNRCLTRRVDPTVAQAVEAAVRTADPSAADHLRSAWAATYGLDPDPDKGYDEAVLAVEALSCPLVCPNNPRRTLGTVIAALREQPAQWALVIRDSAGQPASSDRLNAMLQLLWYGQSRHAGSPNSRRQTRPEAEAAVHMAATLVQWFAAGVLYRR